ncbi:AEC family transporter [Vannielia litorea]|uniref:AEC family transporter n=1 Tax=Vannielia litorea TaxID=1217970 RepID=UPI001C95E4BB|nr:AEC family transporter [Vannielia litorea]MBY6049177.1 AEC family transporter [Vannielia litorea]MBY6076591.1 AEC family transporter [Vannielia litorea]
MNLVLTVAQIVAPVFILAAIGFAWVKLGQDYPMRFITRLVMTMAIPCLIFGALMKTEIDPQALTAVSLAALVAYLVVVAVFTVIAFALRLDRRTYLAPLIFGNTGNLGLPLALFAFGEEGLGFAVVIFAIMAMMSFTFGIWLVSGGGNPLKSIKEPVVIGTALGALFLWQGWQTPKWITNTVDLIAQVAIPLMLITLGVAVARLKPGDLGRSFWLSLLKAALCAAIGVGAGWAFGLEGTAFAVLVLQLITPIAVTNYLLAERFGADSTAVAGLVVASTLLSVAFLPLALAFLI